MLSGVAFLGQAHLEAEVREESPVGTPKDVTVEFKTDSFRGEDPIQRLLGGQKMPLGHSSTRRRRNQTI